MTHARRERRHRYATSISASPYSRLVGKAFGFPREFAFLADGHKTQAQAVGHRRAKQKPPCVDARDFLDILAFAGRHKLVDRLAEKRAIRQHGRDIFEDDSRFGESPARRAGRRVGDHGYPSIAEGNFHRARGLHHLPLGVDPLEAMDGMKIGASST